MQVDDNLVRVLLHVSLVDVPDEKLPVVGGLVEALRRVARVRPDVLLDVADVAELQADDHLLALKETEGWTDVQEKHVNINYLEVTHFGDSDRSRAKRGRICWLESNGGLVADHPRVSLVGGDTLLSPL